MVLGMTKAAPLKRATKRLPLSKKRLTDKESASLSSVASPAVENPDDVLMLQIKMKRSDLDVLRLHAEKDLLRCATWARRVLLHHAHQGGCPTPVPVGAAPGASSGGLPSGGRTD